VNGLGLCEGADQHLFGAVASGRAGTSQGLRQHHRTVACGPMRGPTRALLPAPTTGLASGALPGCALSQARRLAGSKPLEQRRRAGLWPPSFDRIWEALIERHGKQNGTGQMADLLKLSQKHGQQAVESALSGSCYDSAAVQHLLNSDDLRHTVCEDIDVGALERYARPLPVMLEDDQLLTCSRCAISNQMAQLQEATIKAQCKTLRMPMIASQFRQAGRASDREKKTHVGYLEALLLAETEERERNTIERRIREAHLPRLKTLEEFDYTQSPNVTAAKMRDLAEGGYIERAEPVLFIGECGTGKTLWGVGTWPGGSCSSGVHGGSRRLCRSSPLGQKQRSRSEIRI
jgi:hypothetical protein